MSGTMRAVRYDWRKGRRFDAGTPRPAASKSSEVVVEVRAAAINPVDYKLPKLFMHGRGVGLDLAGVVAEVGSGHADLKVGDRVFGNARGTLAEFVKCDAGHLAKIPDGLSFNEAAAMPTVYLSAYQGFVNHGFKAGMKTLVIGASGGTGTAGVQLAKALGAGEIVGVCSGKNEEFVKSLGADRVVDYTKTNVLDAMGEDYFDFAFDCATASGGGENYVSQCDKVLKRGAEEGQGMYTALNGSPLAWIKHLTKTENAKRKLLLANHSTKDLQAIAGLMTKAGGKELAFRPIIDEVFPFTPEGVENAFSKLHTRRTRGKIVVAIKADDEPSNTSASVPGTSDSADSSTAPAQAVAKE